MSSMAVAPLSRGSPNLYLNSDASGSWGWGGHSDRGEYVQDRWDRKQSDLHVNAKEVLAAHKTIDALMRTGDSISIGLDSKTAVAYINKKGGTVSRVLSNLSLALWATVLEKGGWIQAHWIPRGENEVSDMLSKTWTEVWDFGLSPSTVRRIWNRFFIPSMDLFASQRFHLLPLYCSWHVDSNAYARDAFSIPWPGRAFAFPPAPLLGATLQKIRQDRITAIVVAPNWTTSLWWQSMEGMMVGAPLTLGYFRNVLIGSGEMRLPYQGTLMACLVKGGN